MRKAFVIEDCIKQGLYKLNPKNFERYTSWDQVFELLNQLILEVKRKKGFEKFDFLNFIMVYKSLGKMISWDGFVKILDFINTSPEEFDFYVEGYLVCFLNIENHFKNAPFKEREYFKEKTKEHFEWLKEHEFGWYFKLKEEKK